MAPVSFPRSKEMLPDSPFGMGIYSGNRYSSDEMHRAAQMAVDAGIKWAREEITWARVEPQRGQWNWDLYDQAVDTASAHGISLFGLLDYWTDWTQPYTSDGIRDFCEYVRHTVSRYKERVRHWEIWNEPNLKQFWAGTPEQYAELLNASALTCKRADPTCRVIGICTSGTDLRFIEKVASLGGLENVDIVSVHPYRYPRTPEESDLIGELRNASGLLRRLKRSIPLWVTEIGYPTHAGENGSDPAQQARMLVRSYLQCIASRVVEKVFWYDYRDDGEDVNYNEHNFGILKRDFTPKPAYTAFSVMTAALEGLKFSGTVGLGRDVVAYRFEAPGVNKHCLVGWTLSGQRSVEWTARGTVAALDPAGLRRLLRPHEGRITATLSESPLFLLGDL